MDEIKEKFLEILEFYPHSFSVNLKKTPYEDFGNLVITNPADKVHHIFLPNKEDLFRFELSAALVNLGEKHHLLATDYFSEETQEYFYEFIEPFTKLVKAVRFGWAGKVASKYSPDLESLMEETLKRIEIEYLNQLYKGNRRAAVEVLPFIAFAKGLDSDWDFFNHSGLNKLLNELIESRPSVENLLKFVRKFSKFMPCFCSYNIKKDEKRGFEVFNLYL
jgi:hypothetical protein